MATMRDRRIIVHVKGGRDLAISSNAYVVIKMGEQKSKTRAVKRDVNHQWNEKFSFSLENPIPPVQLFVYNKHRLRPDDIIGETEFFINPFLEALRRRSESLRDGDIIDIIEQNRHNCLAEDSQIVWKDGKVVQNMFLRLNNAESGEVEIQLSADFCVLKIHVKRGEDLAIRDVLRGSSDPYVVLKMGDKQRVRTRAVKQDVNPVWNEELTLYVPDPPNPTVQLFVYDKDTLSPDDKMGQVEIDINPIVEVGKMDFEGCRDGTVMGIIKPDRRNQLVEKSQIEWKDGKVVQNMFLRLKNVKQGKVELQLQLRWIDIPGS